MSLIAGRGLELEETLRQVVRRWRSIRCLVLIDAAGLPLASSLASRGLEERLAALAAAARDLMLRAQKEVGTGCVHHLHLAAQDRQLIVVPVGVEAMLAAIVEPDAGVAEVVRQMVTTSKCMVVGAWPPDTDDDVTTGAAEGD